MTALHTHWRGSQEWRELGTPMSTGSDAACRMYDATLTQYTGWYDETSVGGMEGSVTKMLEADPDFVMGHVLKNGLEFMGTGRSMTLDAEFQKDVNRMAELGQSSSIQPWERKHVQALQLWSRGDSMKACDVWEDILVDHPLDLLALKFAHDAYFYLGEKEKIRDSIARVLPHWKNSIPLYGYLKGMHAFGLEETNLFQEAELAARKALDINSRDAWATHALCHVMEMQGRQEEGIKFLDSTVKDWTTCGMLACHNYWHWALYHIEKGNYEAAMDIFDNQVKVRSCQSGAMLDLVDAASLLYRMKLEGVDVSSKWRDVFEVCRPHIDDHQLLFNDVHMLMTCLGAGESDVTAKLMDSIKQYVRDGQGRNHYVTKEVGQTMCEAFVAYDTGDYAQAVDLISPIRYKVVHIGGSNAQRDLFNLFLIHAAMKSDTPSHQNLAKCLLAERKALKENAPMTDRLIARAMAAHAQNH